VGELGDPLLRLEKRVGCFTKKKRKNTKYIIHITIPPAPLTHKGGVDKVRFPSYNKRGGGVGRPSFKARKEGRVFYEKKEEKHKIYYLHHYPPSPLNT
jgi:hypothetical protein